MKFTRYGHRNDGKRYFFLASWKIWNNSPTLAYCIILSYLSIQEKHCGPWQKNFVLFLCEVYFWAFLPPRMGYRMSLKVVYFCKSLPRPLLSDRSLAFACSSLDPLCFPLYAMKFIFFLLVLLLNLMFWIDPRGSKSKGIIGDTAISLPQPSLPSSQFPDLLSPHRHPLFLVFYVSFQVSLFTQPKMNIDPPHHHFM